MQVAGATGDYQTQLHCKAHAGAQVLLSGSHDLLFLHIKAVDDTGHDRLAPLKVG